ncbi:CubicO group peptidase (beta-lactamase class C family) [Caulobacter ginsengisoli]|uniref:CubicO group peptidase (Beta-lactamase class C family) n=1 Tax=Caulobacter ginsengisoli TaxID=400775 RepID=A0ABU0IKX5_9CAUL|nr:serine hydrolase domain-containing protein [Caulobacter ginsengisoli]MDQ0462669.1 CubicO group peptidase (beta-lactamase class C family) [Caulobacter ginsengisoli]
MRAITVVTGLVALALALPGLAQSRAEPAPAKTAAKAAAPAPARTLTAQDLEPWLDGMLPYALQRGDVAGAVVVVVKDGKVLLAKGYGLSDVAARTPVDAARTVFRPGSTSKLFTWTAVMQQVELGRLDLDADVNRYLDFKIPPWNGRPVTLRNLMTHTGGFEETLKGGYTFKPEDLPPFDRYMHGWIPRRVFAPGEVPAYSNYGTALAGYMVERVSGEPFDVYVERHILQPLGMNNSTFRQPLPARLKPWMSKGYSTASAPPKPFELYGASPAGALSATGEDMGHFMIAQLQDGAYGEGRILRPETARMMHSTALTILPGVNRMMLGFYETNRNGRRVIAHAGDTPLFHSVMHLYLDDGVGLFISMNSAGANGAAGAIRTALFEQFTDRYLPGPTPDGRVDPKTAAAHARLMAGEYALSRGSQSNFLSVLGLLGSTKVVDNGDGTISVTGVTGLNDQPRRWREIAPFVWRDVDGKDRLAAKVVGGKVAMFSMDELSPFMMFLPTPGLSAPSIRMLAVKLALGALVLTVLLWPVAAIVRRRYGARFALTGQDAWAYRGVRLAALLVFTAIFAWVWTFQGFIATSLPMTAKTDGWLTFAHFLSLLAFDGGLLVSLWNVWRVWRGKRGWFARTWSVALAGAFAALLWVAMAYHLVGFGLTY